MEIQQKKIEEAQEIREKLFDVLSQFPLLYQARQGIGSKIMNPFASLGKAIKEHINPLSLFLNDIVEEVKSGMTYMEALDRVSNFALRNKYRGRIIETVKGLKSIEEKKPYFLNALERYLYAEPVEVRAERLRALHKNLHGWNKKYSDRYGADTKVDMVPWKVTFREQLDGFTNGTYEYPTAHQLEVFRKALLSLAGIVDEKKLFKWYRGRAHKAIREEIRSLAHLLFDYGYGVAEICGRFREERPYLARFLNNELLSWLESNVKRIKGPAEISEHISRLILLDYQSMIPFRTLYCRLSDRGMARSKAREIERRQGVRPCDFRRISKLYHSYKNEGRALLAYFLNYKFSRTFGDYFAPKDMSGLGKDLTDRFVLRYFNVSKAKEKAQEEISAYSSKGKEEMSELLNLLMDFLSRPAQFKGKRVHVLGKIQSGAMGKVLIGIFKGNIVALKEPKYRAQKGEPDYKLLRLLRYEGKVHSHIQSGKTQYENIVECFGLIKEERQEMLAIGYHPADNLIGFIRRNKNLSMSLSKGSEPILDLETLKVISLQMTKVLRILYQKEVIHRDLKPGNILYLIDLEGKISLIKVIDFGVARALASQFGADPFEKQLVGTLSYMAPEQVLKRSGFSSDIYSFGVILYQILSGTLPLRLARVRTVKEVKGELRKVVNDRRIPLLEANPMLKRCSHMEGFVEIVQECMELDPGRRIDILGLEKEIHAFWETVPNRDLREKILYSI